MGYRRVAEHAEMVFDRHRNGAYARAIAGVVKPGDHVMDLGAGLGLHGLLAAQAGAERVYLVEPEPVVQLALDVARKAGLADRIVILQARVEDIAALPRPVDAIVSVFAGNLLFTEDLLPSLFHARDRHLAPGGSLVPSRAQLWLAPLCAPALHEAHVARWSQPVMGFDYAAGRAHAANELLWLRRSEYAGAVQLAPGAEMVDLDLHAQTRADCDADAECVALEGGLCHGLVGWIRLRVGGEWIDSALASPEVHWTPAFLPLDPPLPLAAGDTLRMKLQRPAFGEWSWAASAPSGIRRHSTFLAQSGGASELARAAPGSRPQLSVQGERAALALQRMREGHTNEAIALELAQGDRGRAQDMLRDVQALAIRFGARR